MSEAIIRDYLPEAKLFTPHIFAVDAVKSMDSTNVILGKNAIGATILCPDDYCSGIKEAISDAIKNLIVPIYSDIDNHMANNRFERRSFGGIWLPGNTYRSLTPAVHHIAEDVKDPALVVLNFPHIGFNADENSFGNFIRNGHDRHSSSCGALVSIYNAIINNNQMPEDQDRDLLALYDYIKDIMESNRINDQEKGLGILEMTLAAQREQISRLLKDLEILSSKENVKVLLFSGIEFDTNNEGSNANEDLLAITDKYYVNEGNSEKI